MIIWGISAFSHDAAISVFENNKLAFASHSERFNKIKNTPELSTDMISYILKQRLYPDQIYFYEKPFKKALRQIYARQPYIDIKDTLSTDTKLKKILKDAFGYKQNIHYVNHHKSHALLSMLSKYEDAMTVVIDAIGEFVTMSIWKYNKNPYTLKCVWKEIYPTSLGLLYSAFTQRVGLTPNEHEYVTMAMASFGKNNVEQIIEEDFFYNNTLRMKQNTHRGIGNYLPEVSNEDLAASIQALIERKILDVMKIAASYNHSKNLVYSGGVALNCVANSKILESKLFDSIFIFPNPGDAGSSTGCALEYFYSKNKQVFWSGTPYLGYEIQSDYPIQQLYNELMTTGVVGIANGKAEFGPRALGNRSILADPRTLEMKDKVNDIKHREPYRPFAPVIMEEHVSSCFDIIPGGSNMYMQYTYKCLEPNKYPAVCHVDGTSRVQSINFKQHPKLYMLLKKWYDETECPMLLNTSLNIKGQPIVNDLNDVREFEKKYDLKVY